ncbi:phosphoglycolate phosphatase [Lentibacillus halodurans]|uniref:Phosphoglycolate phosphatase n=1 Tax=Lentibacillus halodurans TaxID=237679 RepID=A0A1I0Y667_9BACI|nr:HAD-IA family hydrolase [Lentibacillus halodurans]SFB08704.1 phosphoglycolate phosphatase [Lentibacillus halodurans]
MPELMVNEKKYDVEGILFDKDGTLLNFNELWMKWGTNLINEIVSMADSQIMCDEEDIGRYIGVSFKNGTWDPKGPLAIGSMGDLITVLSFYLYQQGMPWNEAVTMVFNVRENVDKSTQWTNRLKPIKGIRNFLERAYSAQIKLGVVTSDDTAQAENHLEILGIRDYFHCVIGHDAVQRGKPFPDMPELACQRLELDHKKTVIIGDSNGDMILGEKAGLLTGIGIVPKEIHTTSYLENANQIIRDYNQLRIKNSSD